MTHSSPERAQHSSRRAAVLVDYQNLHALLAERLDAPDQASTHIVEALGELHRHLAANDGSTTVLTAAYADFDALGGGNLQHALYREGVEPRFAPALPETNTVEVQLAVDATTLLHRRPDVDTFALVTGNRTFLPLVQALRRAGAHAFVAALDPPAPGDFAYGDDDLFMDFLNLLGDDARRTLLQHSEVSARRAETARPTAAPPADARLDSDTLMRTLEIAEEHFGQYDEVYLTPLLRKLSDVLGERFDPKALVSDLENAGAVRLEKREGYPYDYTVLIVNRDHPDVQRMEEDFYDPGRSRYEPSGSAAGTDGPRANGSGDHGSPGGGVSGAGSRRNDDPDYDDRGYDSSYDGASYGEDDSR